MKFVFTTADGLKRYQIKEKEMRLRRWRRGEYPSSPIVAPFEGSSAAVFGQVTSAQARKLGGFMPSGVENQLGLDRVSRCPHVRR